MTDVDRALEALCSSSGMTYAGALSFRSVTSTGLYAIFGQPSVWRELSLGDPPDDRPLYVGKTEKGFDSRDLKDHFGTGRTGWSSPRRSFAALLAEPLALVPVPRGSHPLDRTKRASSFGLAPDSDRCLTSWMREHLTIAMWPYRDVVTLGIRENEVIERLEPPLCIDGKWKPNHWHRDVVGPAREAMTATVRATERGSPCPRTGGTSP